ncbi:hypothetical protein J5J86_19275 [Aquabacter sp. L1I39]|uniref:hypothetical protein n=1 Tax=Aquabacter sp. L1I39 TaxID=2820278 RepID=UPI001ADAC5FF|nr:hypothetical protein [Aquabacter sp. L1I39]QTL02886.1 hypothetical protein J5J86_19275 [Aquabacter sp. L1I39]
MEHDDAPERKDAMGTPADDRPVSDEAVAAAAGGGSLKSLYLDVQRGLWADNPDILREVMARHGDKPAASAPLPGAARKDV